MARLVQLLVLTTFLGVGCTPLTEAQKEDLKWARIIEREEAKEFKASCLHSGGVILEDRALSRRSSKRTCLSRDELDDLLRQMRW